MAWVSRTTLQKLEWAKDGKKWAERRLTRVLDDEALVEVDGGHANGGRIIQARAFLDQAERRLKKMQGLVTQELSGAVVVKDDPIQLDPRGLPLFEKRSA